MSEPDSATPAGPVVARYGAYYRNMRYIMVTLIVAFGVWFGYDGFYGYPEHNRKYDEIAARQQAAIDANDDTARATAAEELRKHGARKTDTDIALQKILCFVLPPLGLLYLGFILYRSRGEYRLADGVLHAPGHPPVPLSEITGIDDALWDRKGISVITYAAPGGATGRITLDDFIYEAKPIREIHKAVKHHLHPDAPEPAEEPRDQPLDGGSTSVTSE